MRTIAMKKHLIALALALPLTAGQNDSFLLRNVTVHPVSGAQIDNGSVLVIDGKIAEVGAKVAPRAKVRIVEGKGLHVYPGMIDAGTVVGISEVSSVAETTDTGEVGEFNPQIRSGVAVNPTSEHIPVTRANGITSVLVLPGGSGGGRRGGGAAASYIQGQASLMHLNGWTWEEMAVAMDAVVQMNMPSIQTRTFNPQTFSFNTGGYAEARRSYETAMQKVHAFFEEARRYQTAKTANAPGFKIDRKMESMLPVLEGKRALLIPAVREREIRNAIEFGDKQKVKIVLTGIRKPGAAAELLAKKQIPVILGSPLTTALDEDEPYDAPYTVAATLQKAGVKIAFGSFGAQFARNLPYEAGQSIAYGLPYDEGLKAVTLNAAEILGVADKIGSIEPGKLADLIVTDGDPLEIKTQVKMMFVKGEPVDLESRHTELYKKYMARP